MQSSLMLPPFGRSPVQAYSGFVVRGKAALVDGVADVIALRADVEMVRVDAARVVAAVHDNQTGGHLAAIGLFPRKAVREDADVGRARRRTAREMNVTGLVGVTALDFPAAVRASDCSCGELLCERILRAVATRPKSYPFRPP